MSGRLAAALLATSRTLDGSSAGPGGADSATGAGASGTTGSASRASTSSEGKALA
jgi:hypothetical protein